MINLLDKFLSVRSLFSIFSVVFPAVWRGYCASLLLSIHNIWFPRSSCLASEGSQCLTTCEALTTCIFNWTYDLFPHLYLINCLLTSTSRIIRLVNSPVKKSFRICLGNGLVTGSSCEDSEELSGWCLGLSWIQSSIYPRINSSTALIVFLFPTLYGRLSLAKVLKRQTRQPPTLAVEYTSARLWHVRN
jgi:hypothetical protein